jgi:ComF family protein
MGIVDWVFPKMCVGCGREGEYICRECQKKLVKPESICPMCCKPSINGWTHPRCRVSGGMERLIVGLPYKGVVQQCLKKVKYKSAWEIISFLFEIWRENCGDTVTSDILITCVPMWREKERLRGFNQADLVADCLVASLSGVSRKADLLERVRETKPMYGLDRKKRRENIEDAFVISATLPHDPPCREAGIVTRVILVDDVWTTGATMRECTKILKQTGVSEVWGVALAR